jgi:hypothetical protein
MLLLLALICPTLCQLFTRNEEPISRQLKKNESFQLLYSLFENNLFIEKGPSS